MTVLSHAGRSEEPAWIFSTIVWEEIDYVFTIVGTMGGVTVCTTEEIWFVDTQGIDFDMNLSKSMTVETNIEVDTLDRFENEV